MARKQKLTDRSNIDTDFLETLKEIHNKIKRATMAGTVATLQVDSKGQILPTEYDLLKIKNKKKALKTPDAPYYSRAQIFRHLALFRAPKETGGFGAPVSFDNIRGGYFYTDINYEFIADVSSPDALLALISTKQLLQKLSTDTPIFKKIADLTDQITNSDYSGVIGRIAIAPHPQKEIKDFLWQTICKALSENLNLKLKILYFGMNEPYTIEEKFSPYQLIIDHNNNYFLWGKINLEEGFAIESYNSLININDIESAEIVDEHFELPKEYEYKKEGIEYKVKLFGTARNEIVNCPFVIAQEIVEKNEAEGSIIIRFTASEFLPVHNWVMSLGANVIPLENQELINSWKNEIYCSVHKSEIYRDWIFLNKEKAEEVLNNCQKTDVNLTQTAAFDEVTTYLAQLALVRAHLPLNYLRTMSGRDFNNYINNILLPSISDSKFHITAKRAGLYKITDSTSKEFSNGLIDTMKIQNNLSILEKLKSVQNIQTKTKSIVQPINIFNTKEDMLSHKEHPCNYSIRVDAAGTPGFNNITRIPINLLGELEISGNSELEKLRFILFINEEYKENFSFEMKITFEISGETQEAVIKKEMTDSKREIRSNSIKADFKKGFKITNITWQKL